MKGQRKWQKQNIDWWDGRVVGAMLLQILRIILLNKSSWCCFVNSLC